MSSRISTASRPKSVTFSHFSELAFIPKDKESPRKWYTAQDTHHFRQVMAQDILSVQMKIQRMPQEAVLSPEDLYECVGIEVCLANGLGQRMREARFAHLNAVLFEQNLQRQNGICDLEKLSAVSEKKTLWIKERAHTVATTYSKIK